MKISLTDAAIKSAPLPAVGRLEIADQRCAGLSLRVTAAGAKSFSFRFRDPVSAKVARATIGTYPDVSLAAARQVADDMRKGVRRDGVNPVEQKRKNREEAKTKTFGALAEIYLEKHARPKKRTADADDRNLRLHVLPHWRTRRTDQISRLDVIGLLDGMVSADKKTQANRVLALISKVFNFALDRGAVSVNPAFRIGRPGQERVKRRVLNDAEIALFWKRSIRRPISHRVGLALRLTLLTAARAGEVAGIARSELLDLDLRDRATWTIPPDRSKNGMAMIVPLSPLAVQTIQEALSLVDDDEPYLFPSPSVRNTAITAHSLAVAMARLVKELPDTEPAKASWRVEPPTPHDLRRTAATRMSSLGFSSDDVAAALNHTRRDVTGRHYDQYDRLAEKRAAFVKLAELVEENAAPAHQRQGGKQSHQFDHPNGRPK
ncbi:tyrosine-type recombinase/integrase [Bosea sp. R86505]|uniref:tyrosine-type recombinase/integrase n=1 Tax=Bosea sp. R86505 TaxID=3101710 RepID=UPI00366F18C6